MLFDFLVFYFVVPRLNTGPLGSLTIAAADTAAADTAAADTAAADTAAADTAADDTAAADDFELEVDIVGAAANQEYELKAYCRFYQATATQSNTGRISISLSS